MAKLRMTNIILWNQNPESNKVADTSKEMKDRLLHSDFLVIFSIAISSSFILSPNKEGALLPDGTDLKRKRKQGFDLF